MKASVRLPELMLVFEGVLSLPGFNILEGRVYPHHPVMEQVPLLAYRVEPELLTELCGLRIPLYLDCEAACNDSSVQQMWGPRSLYPYYRLVASRRYECNEHEAYLKSGFSHRVVNLPLIDDEYPEHVAVYQSVLRAKKSFHMMELGARWGTWGARAIAFLRMVNPMPYQMAFMESLLLHCAALKKVMLLNDIQYSLACSEVSVDAFLQLMPKGVHVDLLHIDIQGAEDAFLANDAIQNILRSNVYRLVVGTHTPDIHAGVLRVYADWLVILDLPYAATWDCWKPFRLKSIPALRVNDSWRNVPGPEDWELLRQEKCYHQTPQGAVANFDGLLVLDNPRFVDSRRAFSFNDAELRVDLRPLA